METQACVTAAESGGGACTTLDKLRECAGWAVGLSLQLLRLKAPLPCAALVKRIKSIVGPNLIEWFAESYIVAATESQGTGRGANVCVYTCEGQRY
eukprot:363869-Chlamydomonas_euryale.AAC.22